MYKCPECGAKFEDPVYESVCLEDLYGVRSQFGYGTGSWRTFANCPECGSPIDTEYDTCYEDEEEDEDDG